MAENHTTPDGSPSGARPSRAFTIPARRLAASAACLNCGTPLKGPFCYYCGQPDKNLLRFFPVLIRDLLEDIVDFDSRLVRTLKPLLLHPGRLTRDYLDGRRFRYVPPLRLYIFSSMAFFILAAMLTGQAIDVSSRGGDDDLNINIGPRGLTIEKRLEDEAAEDALIREAPDRTSTGAEGAKTEPGVQQTPQSEEHDDRIMIGDEPWDRETNPVVLPMLPGFVNDWINDEIEESPRKGREIEANPNLIIDKMFDVLPIAVFVMLPLVALLFKFWYLFARTYYVEHLIHALHNHAFLFLIFILTLLADSIATLLDPGNSGTLSRFSSWFTIALLVWIPVYLLVSLKTVYRQGWFMTCCKFSVIGISYMTLLLIVTSAAAVLSFVLL